MTWVAIAIGGSALIAGGVSAYSASNANDAMDAQTDVAQRQAGFAEQLMDESSPLRRALLAQYGNYANSGELPPALQGADTMPNLYGLDTFAAGGPLPAAVQPGERPSVPDMTALSRDTLERQFGRAREATLAQAPTQGGHLASALSALEGDRALGVTGLYNQQNQLQYAADAEAATREDTLRQGLFGAGVDISREQALRKQQLRQQLFGQASGAGFGQIGPALMGLGGASTSFGNVASTALKGTELFGNTAGDFAGLGLAQLLKQQNTYGDPTPTLF